MQLHASVSLTPDTLTQWCWTEKSRCPCWKSNPGHPVH